MSDAAVARAQSFVESIELPESTAPRTRALSTFNFDAARDQALVVGSELVSFVQGISAQQRSDIVNAILLAQLRAKKVLPQPTDLATTRTWYQQYFDVLSHIGFVIQQSNFQKYEQASDGFEVNQAILEVAAVLLAGAPAALAVLTTTLNALQKMNASSPWITLFDRESRSVNTAHFQVSTVDRDDAGELFVMLTAFALEANSKVTQVLFFKFKSNDVRIENTTGKASINASVLAGVRKALTKKLSGLTAEYVGDLEI
jgi:hypothetical protein